MRRLGAGLCDDTDNIVFFDARRHGGSQFSDYQNRPCGSVADLDLVDAQQDRQHAVAHISDVGGTLHRQLVAGSHEHIDKHLAHLLDRALGALVGVDEILDLAPHERIVDKRDVSL